MSEVYNRRPNTLWRVSAKALIYDDRDRLLVFMDNNGQWEMPGGGWEDNETFEECMERELREEVRVGVLAVGSAVFVYRGATVGGHRKLCIAARVLLDNSPIIPSSDNLIDTRYVDQTEFMNLPFQPGEATVQLHANQIWPAA